MITFKKEDTRQYSFAGGLIEVTYRIADAPEAEIVLGEQWKNTEVFKKFVLSVKSADVEGWEKGVTAEEVLSCPGTYSLVTVVTFDIVQSMRIEAQRKNLP